MEYSQAKKLREKSLGTLLAEQEGGAFSSLKKSVSLKTQAKMTGIQEKFDPMNIAKFMTFGSNWAPAMLGKLTNRKQSSVDYFSGVKRKHKGKGVIEKLASGPDGDDSDLLGILHDIESLLHKTREEDKLKSEEEKNFEEEKISEKSRRHKELMEAITGKKYTEKVSQTASKIDEEDFENNLLGFFGLGKTSFKILKSVFGLLAGPLGGLMLMAGFFTALQWLVQYAANNMTNYAAITPKQAQEMLLRNDPREIEKFGGKDKLEQLVKEGPVKAKDLLDQYNNVKDKTDDESKRTKANLLIEIKQLGGLDLIEETVKDGDNLEVPNPTIESMPKKVPPRPDTSDGKNQGRAKSWDNKWGKYYNDDGTRKQISDNGDMVSDASVEFKRDAADWAKRNDPTTVSSVTKSTPTVAMETPKSGQALQQVQKTNLDLNLPVSKPDPSTIVTNNVNNVNKTVRPRGVIPLVRNNEETLQRLIFNSTRVV